MPFLIYHSVSITWPFWSTKINIMMSCNYIAVFISHFSMWVFILYYWFPLQYLANILQYIVGMVVMLMNILIFYMSLWDLYTCLCSKYIILFVLGFWYFRIHRIQCLTPMFLVVASTWWLITICCLIFPWCLIKSSA